MKIVKLLFLTLLLACGSAWAQSPNLSGIVIPSAATSAATVNSPDISNLNYRGAHIIINVSAYTSGNYTPKIQAKDPVSGGYYDLLVGPAISATGMTVLKIYPGSATSPNGAAADFLPRTWRVQLNGASTPSMTFSVGYFADL
jgi:hypothetical protein